MTTTASKSVPSAVVEASVLSKDRTPLQGQSYTAIRLVPEVIAERIAQFVAE
jgi:hypothetical protein